jgi:hypothetical protein
MRYIPSQVVSVLNRVQRRLTAARPGSVLILVVVLVVLLALMGTALLSTTRGDRYVSSQNTANTQIDLLVEGVVQLVKSAIAGDLTGVPNTGVNTTARTYRAAWDSGTVASSQQYINAYNHWDMPNLKPDDPATGYIAADHPQDKWLAPRLPAIPDDRGRVAGVFWPSITMLPGVAKFDAPFACNPTSRSIDLTLPATYTDHFTHGQTQFTPNFVQPRGYSQVFPAWFLQNLGCLMLAADADGDGIADSGYVKIPVGELDGLTYYYAVRIIDNSSAVNVNTAWSSLYDVKTPITAGTITTGDYCDPFGNSLTNSWIGNMGIFRSHVGLYELAHPGPTISTKTTDMENQALSELGWINSYRFNTSGTTGFADSSLIAKEGSGTLTPPRNDFTYLTQGDFLEHTLARRLDNAGTRVDFASQLVPMKPFGMSDAAALAYHFTLSSLDTSAEIENKFEQSNLNKIPDSVHRGAANFPDAAKDNKSPARNRRSYRSDQIADWVYDNFNWSNWAPNPISIQGFTFDPSPANKAAKMAQPNYRSPLRTILTSYNPVSMLIPQRDPTIPVVQPAMPDYGAKYTVTAPNVRRLGTKTNINTAKFEELWRAFWCVMAANDGESPFTNAQGGGPDNGEGTAFDQNTFAPDPASTNPQRMFRSIIRDAKGTLSTAKPNGKDMVQLRAAAAAVQAMQMRQLPDPTKGKKPYARTDIRTENGYQLKMFGTTPQPFITEVFVWYDALSTDSSGQYNVAPYIAIELYNPFDDDIDISNLKIKHWHREPGMPTKTLQDTGITLNGGIIKRHGFAVIDNMGGGDTGVKYYPPSSKLTGEPTGLAQGTSYFSRPGDLEAVLDDEMIITRVRTGETEEQPVDSFDFSGFPTKDDAVTTEAAAWHYVRRTTGGTQGDGRWGCVYPGRYDLDASKGQDVTKPRQQGTEYVQWQAGTTDPWEGAGPTKAQVTLGQDNDPAPNPSVHEFIIPLPDKGSPGPNGLDGSARKFPFGMFARNGDMLQVPFIASYSVTNASGTLLEMNSISMDASFAEDTDTEDDVPLPSQPYGMHEQIGRFCPITMQTSSGKIDDFNDDQTPTSIPLQRYAWARRLFDYLTVQSPASDYSPDVSPDLYTAAGGTRPDPVQNSSANAAEEEGLIDSPGNTTNNPPGNEDAVSVQGLININTAPWIVLSAIPWVASGQDNFKYDESYHLVVGTNGIDDNIDIAKVIERWRDGVGAQNVAAYGPFRSIFDLYKVEDDAKVRVFDLIQKTVYQNTEPGYDEGEFSAYLGGSDTSKKDGVRNDFREQYLLMTKVSNLITTRSDSFTVYILVQGWRGVGGNHPELVVQRRVSFIQDRSPITSTNTVLPSSVNVPTD